MTKNLIELLNEVQRRQIVKPKANAWCPVKLFPKQEQFVADDSHTLLYFGARGAGKTIATLASALKFVDHPKYRCLIVRKTYKQIQQPGGLYMTLKDWVGDRVKIEPKEMLFRFPSGAMIKFGYVDSHNATDDYKGSEYSSFFTEEADQIPFSQWQGIRSSVRRPIGVDLPIRIRLNCNPPVLGGLLWVYRMFVKPGREGYNYMLATGRDNPHLDYEEYAKNFDGYDEATRRALLEGSCEITAGNAVYPVSDHNLVTQAAGPLNYFLGLDYGASAVRPTTAITIVGVSKQEPQVAYVVESFETKELTTDEMARKIHQYVEKYPGLYGWADAGGIAATAVRELGERYGLPIRAAEKARKAVYQAQCRGAFERGNIRIVEPANERLIEALMELRMDEEGKEVDSGDRHLPDSMLYAWRCAYSTSPFYNGIERPEPLAHVSPLKQAALRAAEQQTKHEPGWIRRQRPVNIHKILEDRRRR